MTIILKRFTAPYISRKMKIGISKIKHPRLTEAERAARKAMELVKKNKYLD